MRGSMTTRLGLLTAALLMFLCVPQAQRQHTPLSDQEIKSRVEHKLSELDMSDLNIQVRVQNGVVTLTGTVPSAWAKKEIIDKVRRVDDVQSIVSELTVRRAESDRSIGEQVAKNIRRYVFYSIFDDVEIQVNKGIVTLAGRVTSPHKAREIAELASRAPGAQEVRNEIQTLPVSGFDDQLRYAIASQIYQDPMFWNYAIQVNPPIHIIVENGRVTLTGVVNSEIEKRKAEIIARGTFGVLGVENKLRVEGKQTNDK